jgi:hypothetical protein
MRRVKGSGHALEEWRKIEVGGCPVDFEGR